MTKIQEFKSWVRQRKLLGIKYMKTSCIFEWGVENYYTSVARRARELCGRGEVFRRVSERQKKILGFKTRESVYRLL